MRQSVSKGQGERALQDVRVGHQQFTTEGAKRSVKRSKSKYGFSGRGEGVRGKGNGR